MTEISVGFTIVTPGSLDPGMHFGLEVKWLTNKSTLENKPLLNLSEYWLLAACRTKDTLNLFELKKKFKENYQRKM